MAIILPITASFFFYIFCGLFFFCPPIWSRISLWELVLGIIRRARNVIWAARTSPK